MIKKIAFEKLLGGGGRPVRPPLNPPLHEAAELPWESGARVCNWDPCINSLITGIYLASTIRRHVLMVLHIKITGDPRHSQAAYTPPCNVKTHSRAHCSPGARLCEQWGRGCVQVPGCVEGHPLKYPYASARCKQPRGESFPPRIGSLCVEFVIPYG